MLSDVLASVEQVPKLGSLVLRIPLPKLVAVREKPLLGPRLFLIPSRAAHTCVELVFLDRVQQCYDLKRVTAGIIAPLLLRAAGLAPSDLDGVGRSGAVFDAARPAP